MKMRFIIWTLICDLLCRQPGLVTALHRPVEQFRRFSGYDCSEPKFIEPIRLSNLHSCPESTKGSVQQGKNSTFLVVQEPLTQSFGGYGCARVRTQLPLYCGQKDHQTMGLASLQIEVPAPITPAECQAIIADRKVTIRGQRYDIQLPKPGRQVLATFKYNSVGDTWFGEYDYSCSGGSFIDDQGIKRDGWTFYTQDKYTLTSEEFTSVNGTITSGTSKLLLSECRVSQLRCQSGPWAFFWHDNTHDCNLVRTTTTTGREYSTPTARGFIAQDKTMLSFLITGKEVKCGRPMLATNFPGVYLTDPMFTHDFPEVSAQQVDMDSHIMSKMQYLYDSLVEYSTQLFKTVLLEFCLSRANTMANFAQTASQVGALQDGRTVHLGGGIFATSQGEVVYKYFCQHREVIAKETHQCWDALPIETPANLSTHFFDLMATEERIFKSEARGQLFLEPYTRRIVATASELPCIELAPYYKNLQDQYVRVSPSLSVPALQPVEVDTSRAWHTPQARILSLAAGGLYSKRILHQFATFTHLRNFRHTIQDTITKDIVADKPSSGKELKLTTFSQVFGIGSSIAAIFSTIINHGGYVVLIAGIVALYSWLKSCCGCCYRVHLLRESVTRWLNFKTWLALCCPVTMTQHSAPGKYRPKPIFNYRINKPLAKQERQRQKSMQKKKKAIKIRFTRRSSTPEVPPPVPPRQFQGSSTQGQDNPYVEVRPGSPPKIYPGPLTSETTTSGTT